MSPAPTKSDLRAELLAARTALSADTRRSAEARIRQKLFATPAWQQARVVLGYMPTRGELDLVPVWQAAVSADKTFALPVTESGTREGHMVFRTTPGFCPDRLRPGRFGILEPPQEPSFPRAVLTPRDRPLILVPGLGFDDAGYRIGYGGGYYDRFLSSIPATAITSVGLCYAACRRPVLPHEAHDRAVDLVIDEL